MSPRFAAISNGSVGRRRRLLDRDGLALCNVIGNSDITLVVMREGQQLKIAIRSAANNRLVAMPSAVFRSE